MSALQGVLADLREKRLWMLVAALLVALVAVPLLLSSGSSTSTPVGAGALAVNSGAAAGAAGTGRSASGSPGPGGSPSAALPQVSVSAPGGGSLSASGGGQVSGPARDPFTQQVSAASAHSAAAVAAPTAVVGTPLGGSAGAAGASTATGSTGGAVTRTGGSSTHPGASTPGASRHGSHRGHVGLRPNQTYRVSLAIANPTGAFTTTNSLQRLAVLSSGQDPLAVELGVLAGGRRVLFAILPGTLVHGPGRCIPGSADCEIVSLAPGQVEDLGERVAGGAVLVARFAVTAIAIATHPSAAAAARARRSESAAGRRLLRRAKLPALSLFSYQPSAGTVRDLRDLVIRIR